MATRLTRILPNKLLPRARSKPKGAPSSGSATEKPAYEVEIRKNDRGGFEIAQIGEAQGIGNYATAHDAFVIACYSWDRAKIKHYTK